MIDKYGNILLESSPLKKKPDNTDRNAGAADLKKSKEKVNKMLEEFDDFQFDNPYANAQNAFEGLDAKTGPTTALEALNLPEDLQNNFPFLTSLKNVYKQTPQLFKNLDIKEAVKFTDGAVETNPVKDKMVLVAEQMIRDNKSKDEIVDDIKLHTEE